MYPNVTVVGYEILPHVLEHSRQLAASLGLGERVEFRLEDVQTATAQTEFDTIVWSQMFFPPETRPATIASLKRALKPSGLLIMPLIADLPALEKIEATLPVQAQLLASLAYSRWDMYYRPSVEIRAELERVGFAHLHTLPHPRTPFVVMRLAA